MSKHLDLGCGKYPRNPLGMKNVYGVDVRDLKPNELSNYKKVNLITQKIPFKDNTFDSLSAFDFLEHIPRTWITSENETKFPFIQLMNEIGRVLKNDGIFLAITPAFPNPQAFQDPTHVNIITKRTVKYFTGESPLGRMYGFNKHFELLINKFVPNDYLNLKFSTKLEETLYLFKNKLKSKDTHLYWKLRAIKK